VTKSQIFNAIYGLFDENVDENVVESHISKLRKKLKHHLGFDPIDSKRYLGYCLNQSCIDETPMMPRREHSRHVGNPHSKRDNYLVL